jgi:undecaprenyl-diphosphatase
MELFRAIVLGVVQGLTEFLPVSSSGHLILLPSLLRWPDQGLAFDAGLHLGTLAALLVYFWRDWWDMGIAGLRDLFSGALLRGKPGPQSRLLLLLALGTIPAAVTGLLLDNWIEEHLREPWIVAIGLAVVATIMLAVDRRGSMTRVVSDVGVLDTVLVGLAQACALMPGVSRSGATMSAGLARGLTRNDAARLAFLLGTPAIAGAALLKMGDITSDGAEFQRFLAGAVASAAVGLAAIHFFMRYLRTSTLVPFVVYRYAIALATLVIGGIRVL